MVVEWDGWSRGWSGLCPKTEVDRVVTTWEEYTVRKDVGVETGARRVGRDTTAGTGRGT